jgi:hypothetical protein
MRLTRFIVMPAPGLDPGVVTGIHVLCRGRQDVDGRNKSGHDDGGEALGTAGSSRENRSY